MQLKLYKFTKRLNSTKQLADATPVAEFSNVYLKQSTDIDNPTFLIEGGFKEANYAYLIDDSEGADKVDSRYYFVTKNRLGNNNIYELECELDSLATYKSEILAHELFVMYSTSNFNRWIRDDRVPIYIKNSEYIESFSNFVIGSEQNLFVANTNETVLITTVSKGEGIVTWITTEIGLHEIITKLVEGTGSVWESLTQQFGDAIGSIVQVMRMPINVSAIPNDGNFYDVYFGTFPVEEGAEPIKLMKLSNSHISAHADINMPLTYTDFRATEPYCTAKLTLPFVGTVDFSLAELAPLGNLKVRADIELMTGAIQYTIHAGGTDATPAKIVASYSGQVGSLIPIASVQVANSSNIVGGLLGSAGTFALGAALANPAMASTGAVTSIMNVAGAFYAAQQKTTSVVGSFSGGRAEFADRAVCLCVQKFLTACEPSELAPIEGRPLCKVVTLNTLTGYCRTVGAKLSLTANAAVTATIERLLNDGIYIE